MKKVIFIALLVCIGILLPGRTFADTNEGECKIINDYDKLEKTGEIRRYAEDNILYYSPYYNSKNACDNSEDWELPGFEGSIDCSADGIKNYAGEDILTKAFLNAIKENYPYYKKSAEKYGIPWQALAAIHYRETRFARTDNSYQVSGGGGGDFASQTDEAASILKAKGSFGSDDAAKSAFFGYNGRAAAYKEQAKRLGFSDAEANNGEGSPYVMNKYDEKRDPNKNGSSWGQIKRDGGGLSYPANQDFGAFVVYKALLSCNVGDNGGLIGSYAEAINQFAINLAWPDRTHDINDPKPAYREALQQYGYTSSGDINVRRGSSCGVFVASVLRKAGAISSISLGAANQRAYLERSPDWVEVPVGSAQPGDVRTISRICSGKHCNHIEIVVSINGSLKIASASYGDRTAGIGNYYSPSAGTDMRVFRRK